MNKLLSKSFMYMFIGLLLTFITGYVVSTNENMLEAIFNSSFYWIIFIVEIALVIFFSARITKMSKTTATICFLLYSFVSGLTFSSIFIIFEISSIMYVFLATAILFGIFGLIGYFTNLDLSKFGTYLLMALIGILICSLINIFLGNTTFDIIISIIAVLIFLGYTAYDINRIKELSDNGLNSEVLAIHGAFELYLDFINIFLHLLSLIGNSKDS